MFCDWFTFEAEKAVLRWQRNRGASVCRQNNRGVEMKVMEKLSREIVLHSLSCFPKRVWPASNWETQGWRGFWGRAKSPVKKRKHQSAWLSVASLFITCCVQSQDLLQGRGRCEHVHVVIWPPHNCIKHVTGDQERKTGLWCLSAK